MSIRSKVNSYAKEVQFSRSVMSGSLWPMDCSTPGLPVHHQLPEFTQTHVHWVGDAIQPSQEDWLYKGMNARRWKHKMMLDMYHTLICILCSYPQHHRHSPRKKKNALSPMLYICSLIHSFKKYSFDNALCSNMERCRDDHTKSDKDKCFMTSLIYGI